jgi:Fe-S oxidoreductase
MNNVAGDAKPRDVVEDIAVAVEDLSAYIAEFDALMRDNYGIRCVYCAHAGAGELHTRLLFKLRTEKGLQMFSGIATGVATLVKKYRGSLSGEHGDGRLRGEFIKFMVGDECCGMMRRVQETFDLGGILNPGKIIDAPPMGTSLRHTPGHSDPSYETIFDFSATEGVLRATERCTGIGECRKFHLMGGTMCPSYMATRNEEDTTCARANILHDVLTHPRDVSNPWNSQEVNAVMDLCLSCKGCKSECPSYVDLARLKAEWQQHYHDVHGVPFRSRLVFGFTHFMRLAAIAPGLYNWAATTPAVSRQITRFAGFAEKRSLPTLGRTTLAVWHAAHTNKVGIGGGLASGRAPSNNLFPNGHVHLCCDEFTNYNDTGGGIRAVQLLNRLGYEVVVPKHIGSGRAQFSKGLVRAAQKFALRNAELLKEIVTGNAPLLGIEPSAILRFRDEYPDLVPAYRQMT